MFHKIWILPWRTRSLILSYGSCHTELKLKLWQNVHFCVTHFCEGTVSTLQKSESTHKCYKSWAACSALSSPENFCACEVYWRVLRAHSMTWIFAGGRTVMGLQLYHIILIRKCWEDIISLEMLSADACLPCPICVQVFRASLCSNFSLFFLPRKNFFFCL